MLPWKFWLSANRSPSSNASDLGPPLNDFDRLFCTTLRRFWPRWSDLLLIVKPETVIAWRRAGFRLYWRWRSRARGGRPRISQELRDLIVRLAARGNSHWNHSRPKIGVTQTFGKTRRNAL
jgi:hypothetical protein